MMNNSYFGSNLTHVLHFGSNLTHVLHYKEINMYVERFLVHLELRYVHTYRIKVGPSIPSELKKNKKSFFQH